MPHLLVFDRTSKKIEEEHIYGRSFLEIVYGESVLSLILSKILLVLSSKFSLLSRLYGFIQKSKISKRKIKPFVDVYKVDTSEFIKKVEDFQSFNDFFIRSLKKEVRPIVNDSHIACLPADARYMAYQHIETTESFFVKGKKFNLVSLLQDEELAARYRHGSMLIARLCPTDYHRFHFPVDCIPSGTKQINGYLYSVNPMALKRNIEILTENKRTITELATKAHGTILFIEVGATCVGTIHETYTPYKEYKKGDEKGYFSFGGSCLILLFEEHTIKFDQDLIENTFMLLETKALMGQSLGRLRKKP